MGGINDLTVTRAINGKNVDINVQDDLALRCLGDVRKGKSPVSSLVETRNWVSPEQILNLEEKLLNLTKGVMPELVEKVKPLGNEVYYNFLTACIDAVAFYNESKDDSILREYGIQDIFL